jgi:hypothetical protein
MDLSPGTLIVPVSGPEAEKDWGELIAEVFDSGFPLWQGAPPLPGRPGFSDSFERFLGAW